MPSTQNKLSKEQVSIIFMYLIRDKNYNDSDNIGALS
jgi:hypothetical protein